jgi:GNAT superfamily N-acetyltransferase
VEGPLRNAPPTAFGGPLVDADEDERHDRGEERKNKDGAGDDHGGIIGFGQRRRKPAVERVASPYAAPVIEATDIVLRCERARAIRSTLVSNETLAIAGGLASRQPHASWGNVAAGVGLTEPLTSDVIDRITAFYDAVGAPARIDLCDHVDRETLRLVADAGYRLDRIDTILTRPLTEADALGDVTSPAGIRLAVVDRNDLAATDVLAAVLERVFVTPTRPTSSALRELNILAIRHPEVIAIGAYDLASDADGGECVGGGLVDVHERIGSLWIAGVEASHRRRGIQGALIAMRTAIAARLGATHAMIESAPGLATQRNAERCGFRISHARAIMVRPRSH